MLGILETIGNFFESIYDFIMTCIDFIIGLVEDIIFLIQTVTSAMASVTDVIPVLFPASIAVLFVGIITIVVLYKILGREG